MANAVNEFFREIAESAINPLLTLLSETLLTTPDPADYPRIGQLWDRSWQLVLAMYGLFVIGTGLLLMVHETLQTQWGLRELLPRLLVGFAAGAMSLILATQAIRVANGLASALVADGVDPEQTRAAFRSMFNVGAGTATNAFVYLMMNALAVVLVVLLISYIIRVALTTVLVIAAPLAMMCYALPGTDGVARWWWRAFTACLAIQVLQSLVLITGLQVWLSPGGWGFFGPDRSGLVNVLVAIAMGLILIKIPSWLLASLKLGHGRTLVGSLVRSFVLYKGMSALKGVDKAALGHRRSPSSKPKVPRVPTPKPAASPYAKVRATKNGQLMLPLQGVRRVTPPAAPTPRIPAASTIPVAAPQGQQLMLPLPAFHGGINLGPTPQLGRGGQYQLPISVQRVPKPAAAPVPRPAPSTAPRGKQLAFDFTAPAPTVPDPYAGLRPLRGGQYPLPIEVRRFPTPPRATAPPLEKPPSRAVGRQLHLPMPDLPVRRRHRRTTGGSK
ncbi:MULTISPECIES: hypothetical protein [unclassified Nocardia]|uniref:hypothetical protein n=1 Tax=unclassified Nocardia TaxID=2637762 RepID=UPI00278C41AB|nr:MULTISPECIES: hypothetical protein [unclassified Nocardia]